MTISRPRLSRPLPNCDGFLWDGGKLHEKWSDTKVVCHNNKAELAVADFGTNGVLKRNIAVHHTAA